MQVNRRDFLKWALASAASLGLTALDLGKLDEALASAGNPPVIWLQGALCTGCTISLLNTTNPEIDDVLLNAVSLKYHPNLNAAAGDLVITALSKEVAEHTGDYILCVEGGIPTAIDGNYAIVGEKDGQPWTMLEAVKHLGHKAKYVVSVGTCAAFGGVVKPSKYTGVKSVQEVLGGKTINPIINLPACPVNPIVLVGTLVHLLTQGLPTLDQQGRPTAYYNTTVHHICPRHHTPMVNQIGVFGCYKHVGCKGPHVTFSCPRLKWNNGVNWCIDKGNTVCIGCASPEFPATPFYTKYDMCLEEGTSTSADSHSGTPSNTTSGSTEVGSTGGTTGATTGHTGTTDPVTGTTTHG